MSAPVDLSGSQLRAFVAAASHPTLRAAAHTLGVSQPTLSTQIGRLERTVGAPLFTRSGAGMELTEAGQTLRAAVDAARRHLDDAAREVADLNDGPIDLVIARPPILTADGGAQIVAALHAFPGTSVRMVELDRPDEVVRRLYDGTVDFAAFVREPDMPGDLAFEAVLRAEMLVSLPPLHPLALQQRVALADLAEEPFVARPESSGMRLYLERMGAGVGFVPRIAAESEDMDQIRDLVAAGVGAAIITSLLRDFHAEVAEVRGFDPPQAMVIGLAWVRGRYVPAAIRAIVEAWRAWAAWVEETSGMVRAVD